MSCCEVHENTNLAEGVAKKILESEEERRSVYKVMLSNVYTRYIRSLRWDEVERLRDGVSEISEAETLCRS